MNSVWTADWEKYTHLNEPLIFNFITAKVSIFAIKVSDSEYKGNYESIIF